MCSIDKSSDGGYNLKVVRQKIWVSLYIYCTARTFADENVCKVAKMKHFMRKAFVNYGHTKFSGKHCEFATNICTKKDSGYTVFITQLSFAVV